MAASLSLLSYFFSLLLSLQATQAQRWRGTVEEPAPLWPTRGGSVLAEESATGRSLAGAQRRAPRQWTVARPLPPEGFFPFGRGGGELPLPWFFFPMPPMDAHGNREEQARPKTAVHFSG
jgi:hypothetical protein